VSKQPAVRSPDIADAKRCCRLRAGNVLPVCFGTPSSASSGRVPVDNGCVSSAWLGGAAGCLALACSPARTT